MPLQRSAAEVIWQGCIKMLGAPVVAHCHLCNGKNSEILNLKKGYENRENEGGGGAE